MTETLDAKVERLMEFANDAVLMMQGGDGDTSPLALRGLEAALRTELSAPAVQGEPVGQHTAFYRWLHQTRPRGGTEGVRAQWLKSSDYKDWLDSCTTPQPAQALENIFDFTMRLREFIEGGASNSDIIDLLVKAALIAPPLQDAKDALEQAEVCLANLGSYQSAGRSPSIHEYGQASRALIAVRAAIASQKG